MSKRKTKKSRTTKSVHVLALTKKLDTQGDAKNSAIESIKDLVIGVIGGGLAGAAIGKPSLLFGLGTTLMGHYTGVPIATTFGVGMMASGGYQISSGVSGLDGMDEAKERIKAFGQNIKARLYLDKIIKPKAETEEGANGMGNVQYFKYPNQELDLGSLESIEKDIALLGEQYERTQMQGAYDDMAGIGDDNIY
jgi:hypothetical protein